MKQLALKTTKAKAAKKEDRVANGGIHRTIKRPHPKFRRVSCLLPAGSIVLYYLSKLDFIRFYFTSCLIIPSIPSVKISRCLWGNLFNSLAVLTEIFNEISLLCFCVVVNCLVIYLDRFSVWVDSLYWELNHLTLMSFHIRQPWYYPDCAM